MVVWTKKAEHDYRAKWPGKACARIAGEVATFEGKPLTKGSSAYSPYAMRGWLRDSAEEKPVKMLPPEKTARYKATPQTMPKNMQVERWEKLKFWCKSCPNATLRFIANNIGLKNGQSISNFVANYGSSLAKEFGKLPRLNGRGFRQGIWLEIMEQ